MKHFRIIVLAAVMIIAASCSVQRYEVKRDDFRGRPNSEMVARMRTNRLDKLVGLSDSQYSRLYKFHIRQARKMKSMAPVGHRGKDAVMGEPVGHHHGRGPAISQDQMDEMMSAMVKMAEKTDRKYRSVLSRSQYETWQKAELRKKMQKPGRHHRPRR